MAYRWNKNTIENKDIVESREFDQAHNEFVSLINGGMDRENLPIECVGYPEMQKQSFGKAQLAGNIFTPIASADQDGVYGTGFSNNNTRGNRIVGLRYGADPINEGDSFFEVATNSFDCQEGMLHIHWKCNAYMPFYYAFWQAYTSNTVARKRYQWKINIDGVTVYDSSAICQSFFTTNIATMIPISAGNHKVSVSLRYPARGDDADNQVLLQYWGGNLFCHNLYR